MSGPGAGGPQTAQRGARRRDQRDDPAGLDAADDRARSQIVTDVVSAFYLHLEVADEPGVLAQVAHVLAQQACRSSRSSRRGCGDQARLVMVVHPVLESRFAAAMERDRGLDVLRGAAAGDPGARGGVRY